MMRNITPSPSEIVMTAMLHLQQDRGTSFDEIVKYAKSKYGLKEVNVKGRISSALRRGLKYKILYRKNGLYRLNRSIVKIPSKSDGNAPDENDEKNKKNDEEGKQDTGKGKESVSSLKKAQRRKKKKSKELFLCPDCQVKVNEEDPSKVEGEKRYELRPRKTPSRGSGKGEPTPNEDPKDGEKSNRRRSQWKDFLKMGISFRGRRSNKM